MLTPVLSLVVPPGVPVFGGRTLSKKLTSFSIPGLLGNFAEEAMKQSGGTASGTIQLFYDEATNAYRLEEEADIDVKLPELPADIFTYKFAQDLGPWEGKALSMFVPVNTAFQLTGTAAFEVA